MWHVSCVYGQICMLEWFKQNNINFICDDYIVSSICIKDCVQVLDWMEQNDIEFVISGKINLNVDTYCTSVSRIPHKCIKWLLQHNYHIGITRNIIRLLCNEGYTDILQLLIDKNMIN